MRHSCEKHGCFEEKYRCKLGKLDRWLPGSNGMTDVDGYCHISGHHLFLEWKTEGASEPIKQAEALIALSETHTVFVAWGNPKEMCPTRFKLLSGGEIRLESQGPDACRQFDAALEAWGEFALRGYPTDWWKPYTPRVARPSEEIVVPF